MIAHLFKYQCLTDLHVGSGDINYNIVDNEVERDAITGDPIIHASGVKGGLREHYRTCMEPQLVEEIFGKVALDRESIGSGAYKFLDAFLLSRPMRLSGSATRASIPVTTLAGLNSYLEKLTVFGCNHYGITHISAEDTVFGEAAFLTNFPGDVSVEGEITGKIPPELEAQLLLLRDVLGDTFALVPSFEHYPLPVVTRNRVSSGRNMWYEEMVPHGSVFYQITITPTEKMLLTEPFVQLGAKSSLGCGFIHITPLGKE